MKKKKMLDQSDLIRRGWTKAMITNLLPAPIIEKNPYYIGSHPMKLWPRNTVNAIMQTPEYHEAKEKADRRRATARKSVEQRIDALCEKAKCIASNAVISIVDDKELHEKVSRSVDYICDCHFAGEIDSEELLERNIVKYIRYELTQYNESLDFLEKATIGKSEARLVFSETILDTIAKCYPKYASECEHQKKQAAISYRFDEIARPR